MRRMTGLTIVTGISLLAILVCVSCSEDESNPVEGELSLAFLSHTDTGCTGQKDYSGVGCLGDAWLKGVDAVGDTLLLDIHFEANCCPEFYENVSFTDGKLDLIVVDNEYGCRCICAFENEFAFLFGGHGELKIDFRSLAPDSHCVSAFDTVITLPR